MTKQKIDWKEVFDFTPDVPDIYKIGVHGENQWPNKPVGFEDTMKAYLLVRSPGLSAILVKSINQITVSAKTESKIVPFMHKISEQ